MKEGARVALVARSERELEANARRLSESGAKVMAFPADVTLADERRWLIEAVEQTLGPVDVCWSTTPAAIFSASSTT